MLEIFLLWASHESDWPSLVILVPSPALPLKNDVDHFFFRGITLSPAIVSIGEWQPSAKMKHHVATGRVVAVSLRFVPARIYRSLRLRSDRYILTFP